jgi:hypothetical protein
MSAQQEDDTDDDRVVAKLVVECEPRADLYELARRLRLRIHAVPRGSDGLEDSRRDTGDLGQLVFELRDHEGKGEVGFAPRYTGEFEANDSGRHRNNPKADNHQK